MDQINRRTRVLMFFVLFLITIICIIVGFLLAFDIIIAYPFVSFFINALSITLLCFSIYVLITRYKMIKVEVIRILSKNPFTLKIVKEYDFRTAILGLGTLLINLAFLSYYLGYTVFNFSIWYLGLTIYYALLFFAREITLYNFYRYPNNRTKEINVHLIVGILLCLLPLFLFITAGEASRQTSKFKEPILHVLVVGGITIYKLTMGIYNALKAHKSHDLIVISLKNINLAEALASLVALMATVLVLTKDDSKVNQISIDLVSFAMIVVTLFLGISMIRRTVYEYKKMQWEEGISGLEKFYQQRKH